MVLPFSSLHSGVSVVITSTLRATITTIELPLWQSRLVERMNANEFKLAGVRERLTRFVELRKRFTVDSVAWIQYCGIIHDIQWEIYDILDDMRYCKQLFFVGPIKGDTMALPLGYGGRTLITIIEEERDKLTDDMEYERVVQGMNMALDVLRNPFNYLREDERNSWVTAEAESRAVIRPKGTTTQMQDVGARKSHKEPTIGEVKASSVKVVRRNRG